MILQDKGKMESSSLTQDMEFTAGSGAVLSPEQKASLQMSLILLKNENKFRGLFFWGKIMGLSGDYYIAQGRWQHALSDRKRFYSKDCIKWNLLPEPDELMRENSRLMVGRFTGDPSHEFEHVEIKKVNGQDEEFFTAMKEENRLASVIADIDDDAAIIPRGAYLRTPQGIVKPNKSFEGLSIADATKLESYLHFRDMAKMSGKEVSQRADFNKSLDFLDPISDDIPQGSWSIQSERGSGLVVLRSLIWFGLTFYHIPNTPQYGFMYMGSGENNKDLPFML
ncbi:PREDICTED: radial spoke head protein 9 homolog [Priapulus caudatus]|uniref:Radial spoke head protein 9 homolog n=1 Tax=Priapulus caudatus TaxID=37621 RepID=A0ABM1E0A5_PRICU|nr:PREDICTED: radial spoke head protein 9 homolog [Priapulus caudatus]